MIPENEDDPVVKQFRERVEAAVAAALPEIGSDQIVTSWVIVIETVDSDGEPVLRRAWSDQMAAWKRDGMLRSATAEGWAALEHSDD
jgi:hypothetical protein